MILKAKDKEIKLVFRTKKIVRLSEKLKGENFDDVFFKAVNTNNIKSLAIMIEEFAEDENDKNVFNTDINKVYDFIDDWKKENNKNYKDLFDMLSRSINDEGFFLKTMSEEEMNSLMSNPMASIDMTEIIKTATNNVATQVVAEEFRGFKA